MPSPEFDSALSKTGSVLSVVFLAGITTAILGGGLANIIATALGFFSSPALFWDYGFTTTTLICGVLIVTASPLLMLKSYRSRFNLGQAGVCKELLLCALCLLITIILAFIPNFSASHQASFFVTLGMKALMISLCFTGVMLVLRGELNINLAQSRMEAREEGVHTELHELSGDDQWQEGKESAFARFARLAILAPICAWMIHLTFDLNLKPHLLADTLADAQDDSCVQYGSACALRSVFLYLENATSFEQARQRTAEALAALPLIELTCPDAADDVSKAMAALSGQPLPEESLYGLSAFSTAGLNVPKILGGIDMQTDVYVFHTRYRIALWHYAAAVGALKTCRALTGDSFEQAMAI